MEDEDDSTPTSQWSSSAKSRSERDHEGLLTPAPTPALPRQIITPNSLSILKPSQYSLREGTAVRSSTAREIEGICRRLSERVSMHDFSHPDFEDILAPDFVAFLEHCPDPHIEGRQAYVDNFKGIASEYPDYRLEILSMSMDVNEVQGSATVWILMRVTGHPINVQRESVVVVFLRRHKSKWVIFKQLGVRGIPGFV